MVNRIELRQTPQPTLAGKSVRGRPFEKGNPGRPPGARNKSRLLIETLLAEEGDKIAQGVIDRAKAGDVRCALWCLGHLVPARTGFPAYVALPELKSAEDFRVAIANVTRGVGDGSLSVEEAGNLVSLVERCAMVFNTHDFLDQIEKLEARCEKLEALLKEAKHVSFPKAA
jgi:hypothetical protein